MSRLSLAARQRLAALVVFLTVGGAVGVGGHFVWQALRYPDRPGPASGPGDTRIVIIKGMSLSEISRLLADKDIINHPEWFRFYASERGVASKIRAGAYSLSARMSPRQILDTLLSGAREPEVPVTVP